MNEVKLNEAVIPTERVCKKYTRIAYHKNCLPKYVSIIPSCINATALLTERAITMKNKRIKKLIDAHEQLIHSENLKVTSHVQREQDDWYLNTLMIENVSTPFKYKRKKPYRSMEGQLVNLTYYMEVETVAGFEIDIMKVVRVKVS